MSDEKDITESEAFQQLAYIRYRLQQYPFANHECIMLKDCLMGIIATLGGDKLPNTPHLTDGDKTGNTGHSVTIGDRVLQHGQQIAEGVVVYAPNAPVVPQQAPMQQALVDVDAAMEAARGGGAPGVPAPISDTDIKPVPGSLMAQALGMGKSDAD